MNFSYLTQFNDILGTFGVRQMITEPTKISNTNSTIFDLICCNPGLVKGVGVKDPSVSNHFLVNSFFKNSVLNRMNLVQFHVDFEDAPWRLIYQETIGHKVSFRTDTILNILDKHAPLIEYKG